MDQIEQAKKLFFEALAFIDSSDFHNAELRLREALKFTPGSLSILTNLAVVLFQQNNLEALVFAVEAVAKKPDNIEALLVIANCYVRQDKSTDALEVYDRVISLDPRIAEAYNNRGILLQKLSRFAEAVDNYDRAIAIEPNSAGAYSNRGNALRNLKRYDEALIAYDKALSQNSALAEAWLGRGNVLSELERRDEARTAYQKALTLQSGSAEAWLGLGRIHYDLSQLRSALVAYDKAFALNPSLKCLEGSRLHARMRLCDWTDFERDYQRLLASVRSGALASLPFCLLPIASTAADQLQCARAYAADTYPALPAIGHRQSYRHDRIRIAYLSADFREHPLSHLIAGMLEHHDRHRFEITTVSWGPDDGSELRARIKQATDFIDVRGQTDAKIAEIVRTREIDIAIDLMGFTQNARTGVFARRASPIQISHLGYVGTMGASYIDYLIADRVLIPEDHKKFYSEKIVWMPDTFQPNDRKRRIGDKIVTRAEVGLPEAAFVFCCFNNSYKITAEMFDLWMRILNRAGGVLWLVGRHTEVEDNLRREASARGIGTERLIFAGRVPPAEYLARLRLADLFLDTLPYNAGTTASDALWVGLPVLTRVGETFAGRMAASLLSAAGLPELVTASASDYEALAVALAGDADRLGAIKKKLADNRLSTALFDTAAFTKHIETAYRAMHDRHQAGLPPDHIHVPD